MSVRLSYRSMALPQSYRDAFDEVPGHWGGAGWTLLSPCEWKGPNSRSSVSHQPEEPQGQDRAGQAPPAPQHLGPSSYLSTPLGKSGISGEPAILATMWGDRCHEVTGRTPMTEGDSQRPELPCGNDTGAGLSMLPAMCTPNSSLGIFLLPSWIGQYLVPLETAP